MVNLDTPRPSRPRTQTGDLDVQLHSGLDGAYHRPAIGGQFTACGIEIIRYSHHVHRHETYAGLLCTRGCFSQFELELSRLKNEQEQDQ